MNQVEQIPYFPGRRAVYRGATWDIQEVTRPGWAGRWRARIVNLERKSIWVDAGELVPFAEIVDDGPEIEF